MTNHKMLAAAVLTLMSLSAPAFAQCSVCALYPNRDTHTGEETPAGKMGLVRAGGAAGNSSASTANNANAAVRDHYLQAPRKRLGH
ncbi:hypothetical protein ABIF90_003712 [Bradyrhizobium japonicum]